MKEALLRPLLAALLLGACANLVGITDTEVTGAGAGGQTGGGQGNAGKSTGGAAGGSTGGSSGSGTSGSTGSAGEDSSGGSSTTGGTGAEAGASVVPAAGAGGGGDGCDCPANTPTCDQGECIVRGPTMVAVNTFFMDSTEVTIGQYAEFLAAKADDVSGQPAECSWNASYAPAPEDEITDELALPMTWVDWCDARAFCEWADKRLCGAIAGGPIAEADALTASLSQWYRGCGGPNSDTHPSLDGVNYDQCNDDSGVLMAAGSTCEGSYPGLFDTQSNASEWIDSCDGETGATDVCYSLGGSYTGNGSGYCTEIPTAWARSDRYNPLGFRCCSK